VDARADKSLRDKGGSSALDIARARAHSEVVELLGGGAADAAGPPPVPDIESSDEEEAPPAEVGPVVVLEHVVRMSAELTTFAWARYERGLGKLAGVESTRVHVSPEPGKAALELHSTIVKRLRAAEATSPEGIDEVMATVKSLQRRTPLQQASGGGTLLSPPTVSLRGEAPEAAPAIAPQLAALRTLRPQYDELRDAFDGATDVAARGLAASKAILLLRPPREAIAAAAAQAATQAAHRKKRGGR
jgi:hypothetical protein